MTFSVRRVGDEKPKRRALPWKPIALAVLSVAGSMVGLYEHEKERFAERKESQRRSWVLKRTLLILIAVLCALILLTGTMYALGGLRFLGVDTVLKAAGTPPPTDAYGHTNVLFLGQGHAEHDGTNLTDAIIVASIDSEHTKSVSLLSLPRDLYFLKTEKMGAGRLNSMYRDYRSYLWYQKGVEDEEAVKEAMRELGDEIGRTLGIDIHHTVKVDFIGFEKAVDLLGGIDVNVPEDIEDAEYPDEQYGYETFSIKAGEQNMDGATALKYARSRHTTSDFDRSARQQLILSAMADKAKSQGLAKSTGKIVDALNIVRENIATTMTMKEIIGFAALAKDIDSSRLVTLQLSDRNGLYGEVIQPGGFLYAPPRDLFEGASVLLPVSIPEFPVTWKQIQALAVLLFHHREAYLAQPDFAILNAAAPSGTARKLATEMTRYGWSVTNIENADTTEEASLVGYKNEEDKAIATFFSILLGIPTGPLPADLPADQREQITIILGEEFRFSPLQDLVSSLQ